MLCPEKQKQGVEFCSECRYWKTKCPRYIFEENASEGGEMKQLLALVLVFGLMAGCAGFRQNILDVSNESLKDQEAKRSIGKNILAGWKLDSGIIRQGLGTNFGRLPQEAVAAMEDLDQRAAKEAPDDTDLGAAIGDVILIYSKVGLAVIQQYAPGFLSYIPAFFGL